MSITTSDLINLLAILPRMSIIKRLSVKLLSRCYLCSGPGQKFDSLFLKEYPKKGSQSPLMDRPYTLFYSLVHYKDNEVGSRSQEAIMAGSDEESFTKAKEFLA